MRVPASYSQQHSIRKWSLMYSPADTVANVVLALAAEFNRHEYVHTLHDS